MRVQKGVVEEAHSLGSNLSRSDLVHHKFLKHVRMNIESGWRSVLSVISRVQSEFRMDVKIPLTGSSDRKKSWYSPQVGNTG